MTTPKRPLDSPSSRALAATFAPALPLSLAWPRASPLTLPRVVARALSFALALPLVLATAPARADDPDAEKRAQASNFFDAGAEAYKAGKYLVAAEAFQKAHEALPSPSLLFSAAQAYRRQYFTTPSMDALKKAITLYREYLRVDPRAHRRDDAMEALQVLVPLDVQTPLVASAEISGSGAVGVAGGGGVTRAGSPVNGIAGLTGGVSGPASPVTGGGDPAASATASDLQAGRTARVLVSANVAGAEVSLDDAPFVPAPLTANVTRGPHRARLRAAGYDDADLTVPAVPNELVARHVSLHPKPAKLTVTGTPGARISIDGQVRATVPNQAPLAVEPGSHFVAVTLRGHEPLTRRIEVARDQPFDLKAELSWTRQRVIAWSTLSVGAAGLVATGVLTGLTFSRQSEALTLSGRPASEPLSPTERDTYNRTLKDRNDFGQAAGIAAGASAALLAAGVGLFVLDEAEVVVPEAQPSGPATPVPRATFEVGLASVGVTVLF